MVSENSIADFFYHEEIYSVLSQQCVNIFNV